MLLAYNMKFNPKRMKKLEKEYTVMKTKEQEEMVELRVCLCEEEQKAFSMDNVLISLPVLGRAFQPHCKRSQAKVGFVVLMANMNTGRSFV